MNIYYDGGPLCRETLPCPFPEADESIRNQKGSLETTWPISSSEMKSHFFEGNHLDYLLEVFIDGGELVRLVSHPVPTTTCKEKSDLLGLYRSRVIKALYFAHKDSNELYAVVVPDFGSVDLKSLSQELGFNAKKKLRLVSEEQLVGGMTIGTCTPFIPLNCANVAGIIFDENVIHERRNQGGFDDFSIVLGFDDVLNHQLSIQMNYATAFDLLKKRFPNLVRSTQISYDRE